MTTNRTRAMGIVLVALLAIVVLAQPAGAASSQTLQRDPYVTDLTASSATVNWALTLGQVGSVIVQAANGGTTCPSTIGWSSTKAVAGPAPSKFTVSGISEFDESVTVGGLSAGKKYCYAVFPSATTAYAHLGAVQSFTTLGGPVTFDILGDTGENSTGFNQGQSNLDAEIGSSGAQFLVLSGDVAYTGGTETDYGDLTHVGSEVSNIFGPSYWPLTGGIPTFTADGNHGQNSDDLSIWPEASTVTASGGTYAYGPPPSQVDGITNNSPSAWYAVQDGNVRVYVLDAAWADNSTGTTTNSLCAVPKACADYQADGDEHWQASSTEYQWLQKDLAAHPGGVKVAVFHFPVASDTSTQTSDPYLAGLSTLLASDGVKLVVNGHSHTFQRIRTASGSLDYTDGAGGATLQPVLGGSKCTAFQARWGSVLALGLTSAGNGSACGTTATTDPLSIDNYLRVTVTGTTATVSAINAHGATIDIQSVSY